MKYFNKLDISKLYILLFIIILSNFKEIMSMNKEHKESNLTFIKPLFVELEYIILDELVGSIVQDNCNVDPIKIIDIVILQLLQLRTLNNYTDNLVKQYMKNNLSIALKLNGIDINKDKKIFLIDAAKAGYKSTLGFFVSNVIDIKRYNKTAYVAFCLASRKGYIDIIKTLIKAGLDCNFKDNINGLNYLMILLDNFHLHEEKLNQEILDLFLSNGIDINDKDFDGDTILIRALDGRYEKFAKLLIDSGADINIQSGSSGSSALILAIENGYNEMVKILIDKGANVNAKDNKGYTALIKVITYCPFNRFFVKMQNDECIKIARFLIDNGANVNAQMNNGYTPLIYAVIFNKADMVRLLISNNADINIKDMHDRTALSVAIAKDYNNIINIFLENF